MGRYVILGLAGVIGVLITVSLITFILMKAVPASPFDIMAVTANKAIRMRSRNHWKSEMAWISLCLCST
jgi:ABC-type dipeptide/oligopeptide/nickel transport system permease component